MSTVNRLDRSTSVPIAERFKPMIRSPSQCPGTARSSASAGRLEIITSSLTCAHALACVVINQARGCWASEA